MSKKIISQLEEISALGREIVQIAYELYGRDWNKVRDNIHCYLATNSAHRALQIDNFEVNYFNPVQFELRVADIPKLPSYINRCKNELERLKKFVAERDVKESERLKQERIEGLKKELSELEGQS
jgi:hypothetical protein